MYTYVYTHTYITYVTNISFSKRIALLQIEQSIPLTVEAENLGIANLHFWKTNSIFFFF